MTGSTKILWKGEEWVEKQVEEIWKNLQKNHLWQRMLKNTLATTITIILALIPAVVEKIGKAAYLAPMVTVFGHPGRRFGMMAEALILTIAGTLLGIGWSVFGLYLSSLIYETNPPAAYTIRGLFLTFALLLHGFLRSHTPRLFIFVLLMIIVSVVSLTSVTTAVSKTLVTQLLYPILMAAAVLLLVNTLIFPEFSSSFLGITTIETLGETVRALRDAGKYFINTVEASGKEDSELNADGCTEDQNQLTTTTTLAEKPAEKDKTYASSSLLRLLKSIFRTEKTKDSNPASLERGIDSKTVKLKSLTDSKAKLRAKLASCKAAQTECNFELAFAVLPPRDLKPISDTTMKKLVANTIALIGACESKYALVGDEDDKKSAKSKDKPQMKGVVEDNTHESGDDSSRPTSGVDDSHDESADERREKRKKEKRRKKKKKDKRRTSLESEIEDLELVKPRKEIEFGDVELLKYLVNRISKPLADLQEKIDRSVDVVSSCLAYCYDVPKLPSGARAPKGIELQEIDIRVDILSDALVDFDRNSAAALEGAASMHDLEAPEIDIMPRMETFLISSFLLNLRQAALHTLEMLRHSRIIVEKRQARHDRRRLYAPRINWRKWLSSGGEEDMLSLPSSARKDARTGTMKQDPKEDGSKTDSNETLVSKRDIESAPRKRAASAQSSLHVRQDLQATKPKHKTDKGSFIHRVRNGLADSLEYLGGSDDFLYAIKLAIAVFLVTWPAFLHQWNAWYSLNRGLWAALQLVLITEVAIGTSVNVFILRAAGTTLGCVWGYAAYQARDGDRVVCVVLLVIGIIPSTYVQLGTQYIKAGMVCIISMAIVVLATEDSTVPGSATTNFLQRLIAFLIGGVVALVVEIVLFPVKARDRLVESLASCIRQISEMEACLAYGVETETNINVHSNAVSERFIRAKGKAEGALTAAETFLPFCANEPRLKGSFKGLALVYAEILYVLHAIVDKMDNMLHLRQEYGSGVLEELNTQVYQYRRNLAGSITIILFAVHEALTTKLPLPQFLPSARLAHLRMINRVREVILERAPGSDGIFQESHEAIRASMEVIMVKRIVRQKYQSWNAASAGQIEVIEYLEELIDLTKLLVGANEFRSGLLTRPTHRDYFDRVDREQNLPNVPSEPEKGENKDQHGGQQHGDEEDELRDTVSDQPKTIGLVKRRTTFRNADSTDNRDEAELPKALQRVRSRRLSWVAEENNRLENSRSRGEEDPKSIRKRTDR